MDAELFMLGLFLFALALGVVMVFEALGWKKILCWLMVLVPVCCVPMSLALWGPHVFLVALPLGIWVLLLGLKLSGSSWIDK